jgi:hypothetical protein
MRHTSRGRRRPHGRARLHHPPAPLPPGGHRPDSVESAAALAALFRRQFGSPTGPRSDALFTDLRGLPLTAAVHEGPESTADLIGLCLLCTEENWGATPLLLLMVTWRSGPGLPPAAATSPTAEAEADRTCWRWMLEATSGTPVHLVDWVIADGDGARSLSSAFGRRRPG